MVYLRDLMAMHAVRGCIWQHAHMHAQTDRWTDVHNTIAAHCMEDIVIVQSEAVRSKTAVHSNKLDWPCWVPQTWHESMSQRSHLPQRTTRSRCGPDAATTKLFWLSRPRDEASGWRGCCCGCPCPSSSCTALWSSPSPAGQSPHRLLMHQLHWLNNDHLNVINPE